MASAGLPVGVHPPCRAAKINLRRRRTLRVTGRQTLRNNHETESTHNCGGAAPHPRHGSREKLEALGTLSFRAAMGNCARGLFGLGKLLGLLPPRSSRVAAHIAGARTAC